MYLMFSQWPGTARTGRHFGLVGFLTAGLALATLTLPVWAQEMRTGAQPESNLDARDAHGLTPLVAAASAGDIEAVRSLLTRRAGVNATSADGRSALIAATQNGHIDVVRSLIAAGADLNAATRGTGTALEVAEKKGETEIAALLLKSGARSSGKSVGDTVCVLPWGGDGFCGRVKSFSVQSVEIQITRIMGCTNGCEAKVDCSASKPVAGISGLRNGDPVAVPSWCLTKTGVRP